MLPLFPCFTLNQQKDRQLRWKYSINSSACAWVSMMLHPLTVKCAWCHLESTRNRRTNGLSPMITCSFILKNPGWKLKTWPTMFGSRCLQKTVLSDSAFRIWHCIWYLDHQHLVINRISGYSTISLVISRISALINSTVRPLSFLDYIALCITSRGVAIFRSRLARPAQQKQVCDLAIVLLYRRLWLWVDCRVYRVPLCSCIWSIGILAL